MLRKLIISFCAACAAFWVSLFFVLMRFTSEFWGYAFLVANWSLLLWMRVFPNPPHGLKVWPINKAMLGSFLTNALLIGSLVFIRLTRREHMRLP